MSWLTGLRACAASSSRDWEEKGWDAKGDQNLVPETGEEQMLSNWKSTIVSNWANNHPNPIISDHFINSVYPSFFIHPHLAGIEVLFCPETPCCLSPRPSPPVLIFRTHNTFGWSSQQPQKPGDSFRTMASFSGVPSMELLQAGSWWLTPLASCLAPRFPAVSVTYGSVFSSMCPIEKK